MATTRFATAGVIIGDAAVELNLARPSDPYTSTDQNIILLRSLLNTGGNQLLHDYPWLGMVREASLTITPGDSGAYSLPDDFLELIDQTTYDRGTRWQADGPYSSQGWQHLKAQGATATVSVPFRIVGDTWQTYPQPVVAAATLAMEYRSRAWVRPAVSVAPDADTCTAASDVVMFDPLLVKRLLQVQWKRRKGYDSTAEQADFDHAMEGARSAATPGRVLSMCGPQRMVKGLNGSNYPDSGWGP